uniref:DNL-type domain-containing protein n=1 Tax=Kalanchoe fedtschenkoi TaxID=63787 RepID=A0A7N0RHV0_KALFE
MAARRLFSHFLRSQPQPSLRIEKSLQVSTSTNTIFTRNDFLKRSMQSQAEKTNKLTEINESHEIDHSTSARSSESTPSQLTTGGEDPSVEIAAVSKLKPSPRHDVAAMFTCKVCDTRSIKTFSRESYEKGVVVARCGGCDNLHLLADRLGWFGEPGSIEDLLAARGEEVKIGSTDTLSLTLEDLAGTKRCHE